MLFARDMEQQLSWMFWSRIWHPRNPPCWGGGGEVDVRVPAAGFPTVGQRNRLNYCARNNLSKSNITRCTFESALFRLREIGDSPTSEAPFIYRIVADWIGNLRRGDLKAGQLCYSLGNLEGFYLT